MSRAAHTFLSGNKQAARAAIGAIAMLAMAVPALTAEAPNKDEVFQVTTVIQVPGAAAFFSFDISWVDPALNKYFLADRNNKAIDVLDPANLAKGVTRFPNPGFAGVDPRGNDFSGPDGVLTANNHTELWVGDSPGKVWVMDSTTGAIKTSSQLNGATNPISVGGTTRADELCYDPKDNLIMIASPGEDPPFVTFISTKTYKVVKQLKFPQATNGLEQCEWSPTTGKFYQNVPEVNGPGNDTAPGAVAVINPKTMTVEQMFPIPLDDCAGPQGMALGPHNQILLGCNAKSPNGHRNSVVINQHSGAVLGVLTDLGGADAVWFNEGDGHYVIPSCNTACRTVPLPGAITGPELLGIVDANGLRLDHSVTIALQNADTTVTSGNPRTAHSVAADPNTNQIFLPIPAVGGNVPHFTPSLCDSRDVGRITVVGSPSSATGCIAVLTTINDDRSSVAQERRRDDDRGRDRGDDQARGDDR
jgi:hypothetical protein